MELYAAQSGAPSRRLTLMLAGAAALALWLSGCTGAGPVSTGGPSASPGAAGAALRLNAAGATFPFPLYSKWFDAYHKKTGVQVNYQSIGSGGGIQQLKKQTVDFGASDAPMSDEELSEMPSPVEHLPTVAGAVVVAYNLPNVPTGLKLTQEAVAGIFLGRIKRWNDPAIAGPNRGVSLPNTPIVVAHRSDGSGTSYVFTNYLAAVSPEWKAKVGAGKSVDWPVGLGGKGNEGVTGLITSTEGAVGYVELAYAHSSDLAVASIRNLAGQFIAPTVPAVTAAARGAAGEMEKDIRAPILNSPDPEAYPIASFTYLLVYRRMPDAKRAQAVLDLLHWCNTEGQKLAAALDYAPLPDAVVKLNEATLERLRSANPA